MPRRRLLIVRLLVCQVALFAIVANAAEDRLELLDGKTITAEVAGIQGDKVKLNTPGGSDSAGAATTAASAEPISSGPTSAGPTSSATTPATVDLSSLRQIVRTTPLDASRKAPLRVYLIGGGQLQADRVLTDGDNCTIDWTLGKELAAPIDLVRAIRLAAPSEETARLKGTDGFDKAIVSPGETDRLFVIVEEAVQPITGVFEELTADEVVFNYQEKSQRIPRGKVYGLVIAPVGKAPDRSGHALVGLSDGSALPGRIVKLDAGKLTLELEKGAETMLPWEAVTRVAIVNDRLAFLSDADPVEVSEAPVVTLPRPWQRDKNVLGRPLVLGSKMFAKGLGVHSRSQLVYDCDGYEQFAATVGIDAGSRGRGDCEIAVLANGRELLRKRIRGGEAPLEFSLVLGGAKRLTLLVEPGEDLDLADHLNWADARLVREPKTKK